MNPKQSCWGTSVNEDFNFLIIDRTSTEPIHIESIGITYPNPNYYIYRESSEYFIFEYIISGKGYIEANGTTYEVHAGDVYCLEPGGRHTYYADKKDPYQKIWINVFSDLLGDVFKKLHISGKIVFTNSEYCRRYFDELLTLRKVSGNSSAICYSALSVLLQLMCTLADTARRQNQQIDIPNTSIAIKNILDQNIYDNITIEEIALTFNYDKAHIIREFERYYHQTPYQYLLSQKMTIAKQLLSRTSVPVTNISEQLGFKSVFYFSRIFKKKTGMSPSDFRKQSSVPPQQ